MFLYSPSLIYLFVVVCNYHKVQDTDVTCPNVQFKA